MAQTIRARNFVDHAGVFDREIIGQLLPFFTLMAWVLGTCIGSFLNVVVWRMPRGESLSHPPSHCPKCNRQLRPWENIPILSWLALRARCSNCGLPISPRYPLVEALTGILYLFLWQHFWDTGQPWPMLPAYFFLGGALVAVSLIDLEHFLIPNRITVTGMVLAFALAAAFPETHIARPAGGPSDDLIAGLVLDVLRPLADLTKRPRLLALLDAFLGLGFGYALLAVVMETGKRFLGTLRMRTETPLTLEFDAETVRIGEEYEDRWDEVFFRRTDRFTATVAGAVLETGGEDSPAVPETGMLTVDRDSLSLGDVSVPIANVRRFRASTSAWTVPREVMGHGDLKLLAMIGAFLGADTCVFVVTIAAFLGFAAGLVRLLRRPASHRHALPFGPFLSAACLLWIFFGHGMFDWYGRLLARLLPPSP